MRNLISMTLVLAATALLLAGCATTPKGPSDEEMIMTRLQEGITAMKAKDYAAFDKLVSNSFSSYAVGDKADLLAAMEMADSMGLADDFEVDLSEAKVVVEEDKSTVGPITVNTGMGSITVTGFGIKENGIWMVAGGEEGY